MNSWPRILSLLALAWSIMALVSAYQFVDHGDWWHLVWTGLYFVNAFVLDMAFRRWKK